ncbi:hypothetical protein HPB47_010939 [Ixodes persulcatus]|uniref:Uncharacterized protein n=1 Tax=Ixodes persulcatus TaxID=34615 RepID=A0AC60NXP2_IXOPE|nr:hypothetical protein HPB47_010939 [Ixodes persulcatus]
MLLQEVNGTSVGLPGYEHYVNPSIPHKPTRATNSVPACNGQAAIYIDRSLPQAEIDTTTWCTAGQEIVAVRTQLRMRKYVLVSAYYRPQQPRGTRPDWGWMYHLRQNFPKDIILIGGHFNARHLAWGYGTRKATELKTTNHRNPVIERIDSGAPAVRTAPTVDEIQTGTIADLPGCLEGGHAHAPPTRPTSPISEDGEREHAPPAVPPSPPGSAPDSPGMSSTQREASFVSRPIPMPVERVMNETPELSTNNGETTGVNVPTLNSFECLGGDNPDGEPNVERAAPTSHDLPGQETPSRDAELSVGHKSTTHTRCRSEAVSQRRGVRSFSGRGGTWIRGDMDTREHPSSSNCGRNRQLMRCSRGDSGMPRREMRCRSVPSPTIQAEIRAALTALVPRIVAALKSMITTTIPGLHAPTLDTE